MAVIGANLKLFISHSSRSLDWRLLQTRLQLRRTSCRPQVIPSITDQEGRPWASGGGQHPGSLASTTGEVIRWVGDI